MQTPTNPNDRSEQSSNISRSDWTMPPQPLPESASYQTNGPERSGGAPGYYGAMSPPSSPNYSAPYYPNPNNQLRPPKQRNPLTVVVLILAALVIILGATVVLVLLHTSSLSAVAAPTPTQQASTGQATPTPAATSPATTSPTATPQVIGTVPSGIITENLLLTCGTNCDDPIRVTVATIQVNDADGNMIWNTSLQNVSGTSMTYRIDTFELSLSGTQAQTQISANFSQDIGTLADSNPKSIQIIFAFVPTQNTTYTLTVVLEETPYIGPQITFNPTQITNL